MKVRRCYVRGAGASTGAGAGREVRGAGAGREVRGARRGCGARGAGRGTRGTGRGARDAGRGARKNRAVECWNGYVRRRLRRKPRQDMGTKTPKKGGAKIAPPLKHMHVFIRAVLCLGFWKGWFSGAGCARPECDGLSLSSAGLPESRTQPCCRGISRPAAARRP